MPFSMKKIFVFLAAALCCASLAAQDLKFTRLFTEDNATILPLSNQGCVILGDCLFQFRDRNRDIRVYHMPDGKQLGEIPMQFTETYHNNNVVASTNYARKGDEFPVVYASQENKAEHKILAYRLFRKGKNFCIEQVQEINLPSPIEMGVYYPNLALDNLKGKLYVTGYSAESWSSAGYGNGLVLLEFNLPALSDGASVTLGTDRIISRRNAPFRTATQGAAIRNGKLYQVFGVPNRGQMVLCCTDLADCKLLWTRNLVEAGIPNEPEGLSFYKDELIVEDVYGNIYSSGIFEQQP